MGDFFSLSDKTAIVTGAAGGIGNAVAARLAQAGARVVITDIVDGTDSARSIGAEFIHMDVGDEISVQMASPRLQRPSENWISWSITPESETLARR